MLPQEGCHPSLDGRRAKLVLRDRGVDRRDVVQWTWSKGVAMDKADFAHSLLAIDYELCVYDATRGLVLEARTRSDITCGSRRPRSCWKESRRGFKYYDRRSPSGLAKISLKAGAAGRSQVTVQGSGPELRMPPLPLDGPLVVQLRNPLSGTCWSAVHDRILRARPDQLKAVGR